MQRRGCVTLRNKSSICWLCLLMRFSRLISPEKKQKKATEAPYVRLAESDVRERRRACGYVPWHHFRVALRMAGIVVDLSIIRLLQKDNSGLQHLPFFFFLYAGLLKAVWLRAFHWNVRLHPICNRNTRDRYVTQPKKSSWPAAVVFALRVCFGRGVRGVTQDLRK